jgi:hypothetical protein
MSCLRYGILYCLFAGVISVGILPLRLGQNAPAFELPDQLGKVWRAAGLRGQVVVVIAADRNSGRTMGPWVDKLRAKYDRSILILGLLDLHDIPWIGRGMAKSRIRKETNDPMMLDFHGDTAKAYEAVSKYPVVTVIGKSGAIGDVERTNYTPSAFKSVTDAIDAGLKAH